MSLEGVFLKDIFEHPAEDTPRLVYADWLDEHGDSARAEFIRLQIEAAAGGASAAALARLAQLWAAHGPRWLEGLPGGPWAAGVTEGYSPRAVTPLAEFRRGFVGAVALSAEGWLTHGRALLRAAPLQEVVLTNWKGLGAPLAAYRHWPAGGTLYLRGDKLGGYWAGLEPGGNYFTRLREVRCDALALGRARATRERFATGLPGVRLVVTGRKRK